MPAIWNNISWNITSLTCKFFSWQLWVFGRLKGVGGRLKGVGGRLDGVGGRLDGVGGRLDGVGGRLDGDGGQLDTMHGSGVLGIGTNCCVD